MDRPQLKYIEEAIRLAEKGRFSVSPNPMVGCVIVNKGSVVGRGSHLKAGMPHAEIIALKEAKERAGGSDVYVTLEPCCHHGRTGPCTEALQKARVKRVIYARKDPNPKVAGRGAAVLKKNGIEVVSEFGKELASHLNIGFEKRMRIGMPKIRVKVAMSLDGNSALSSGESKWITSEEARLDVQRLRAEACGVLTGIGTVLSDNPMLNVRDPSLETLGRQPHRIILDTDLRLLGDEKLFNENGQSYIFTASTNLDKRKEIEIMGAKVINCDILGSGLNLEMVLEKLANLQINELLIEAGSQLTGSFLRQGLWDELIVFLAPKIIGSNGRKALNIPSPNILADVLQLDLREESVVGRDVKLVFGKKEEGIN